MAEAIEAAELSWLAQGGDILDNAKHVHQARAVAAHMSRPETIERMKAAHKAEAERWAIDSGIADHQAVFEWPADVPVDTGGLSAMEFIDRQQMRAAVAAVVGEGV